jgi:ABC-2 type transport system ATP-binding protein
VPAIIATGLSKSYGQSKALDGVDIRVDEGEVNGLLGPNGAGKTTLMRILFGLIRPDAGEVELLGRRLAPPDDVSLDGVAGFVEDPKFYPYLSAQANLEILATLDGGIDSERIHELLEFVDLLDRRNDRVAGFSTGMRQRLGMAAALLRRPRLLLLDEPTAGLDPAGIRDMGALIRDLSTDGVAIVVSSHQINEVESVCDSFTVLRRGGVAWSGRAEQLRAEASGSGYRVVTQDDDRALAIARSTAHVDASLTSRGELVVFGDEPALDELVVALAGAQVALRRLELLVSPLESMYFALTREGEAQNPTLQELAERTLAATQ